MSKKIKCIRHDNSIVWLSPNIAHNKNRQRQMGFFPEEPPIKEEEIVKEPETEEVEEAPEEVSAEKTHEGIEEIEGPELEPLNSGEGEPKVTPEAASSKFSPQMEALRQKHYDKFGKFPPSNAKQSTIKKKLNG